MVMYSYRCDKCNNSFTKNFRVSERDSIVGNKCDKCENGIIIRTYNTPNITFDMLKSNPSDLKLVINKLKDKAKLDSIIDEEIIDV